eukprot:9469608-Pyramimonas_sp.AAC.1
MRALSTLCARAAGIVSITRNSNHFSQPRSRQRYRWGSGCGWPTLAHWRPLRCSRKRLMTPDRIDEVRATRPCPAYRLTLPS